jgi:hypothetical protein
MLNTIIKYYKGSSHTLSSPAMGGKPTTTWPAFSILSFFLSVTIAYSVEITALIENDCSEWRGRAGSASASECQSSIL